MKLVGLVTAGLLFQGCMALPMSVHAIEANRYHKPGSTFETTQYDLQYCNVYGLSGHPAPGKTPTQECMESKGYTRS